MKKIEGKEVMAEHDDGVCESSISLPRCAAREIFEHLKRAGHDRLGKSHMVYPEPGTWSFEIDIPGCVYGLLPPGVSRRSFSTKEDERIEKASIKDCVCGYNTAVDTLKTIIKS